MKKGKKEKQSYKRVRRKLMKIKQKEKWNLWKETELEKKEKRDFLLS